MSKILFKTKGTFHKGERIYDVNQDVRICQILEQDNCREFKKIIRRILMGLSLLSQIGLVHCDLKSENILISFDFKKQIVSSVKIIDFGTSFNFNIVNQEVQVTTPEYLPPEILDFVEFRMMNMVGYNDSVQNQLNIERKLWQWSIDIWSLGVIILETVTGFPIWMSYKGRIVKGNRTSTHLYTGTFAVQGRVPTKIAKLQQEVASNLPKFWSKKHNNNDLQLGNIHRDREFIDFLQHLLHLKPKLRKSPDALLGHRFLQS